jgi:hypothetical protein
MQEHIMRDEVKSIRKIKIDGISLKLTADNGRQKSRNVTKLVTVDLVLVRPCWLELNSAK